MFCYRIHIYKYFYIMSVIHKLRYFNAVKIKNFWFRLSILHMHLLSLIEQWNEQFVENVVLDKNAPFVSRNKACDESSFSNPVEINILRIGQAAHHSFT